MFSVPSQPGENRDQRLGEFESRSVKTRHEVEPRFSPGYEGKIIIKIILPLDKEKDDIRSAYAYFKFFHESVNSHNLETEPIILLTSFSCFIAL